MGNALSRYVVFGLLYVHQVTAAKVNFSPFDMGGNLTGKVGEVDISSGATGHALYAAITKELNSMRAKWQGEYKEPKQVTYLDLVVKNDTEKLPRELRVAIDTALAHERPRVRYNC